MHGQRLAAAGVPEGTGFRTKPQLLQLMIERVATAGIPFGWVTADEAYGDNGPLRACLEERGIAYVLAVARAHVLTAPAGRHRADALAAKLPSRAWQRLSCGDGAKGERRYDWAVSVATAGWRYLGGAAPAVTGVRDGACARLGRGPGDSGMTAVGRWAHLC
jgi:SRSO17 transposase